jgi:hypothetical protein
MKNEVKILDHLFHKYFTIARAAVGRNCGSAVEFDEE